MYIKERKATNESDALLELKKGLLLIRRASIALIIEKSARTLVLSRQGKAFYLLELKKGNFKLGPDGPCLRHPNAYNIDKV